MSKALRTIGMIAAAAALIATGVGAVAGAVAAKATTVATAVTATKVAAAAAVVAKAATVVAIGASVGAQITAPKPVARGSPATLVIDVEPPRPYIVGQVMTGGVLRYDNAYGGTVNRVPNPYRWQVRVLSGVGPVQGIVGEYFDFQPLGGFYTGYFATTQQLGQRPESAALVPPYGAAPGWTSASKLSGCAAVGLNFLFDRDGERFASGLPVYTALVDGEKVYDPRQDSTYPGGSGPCRLGVESTYVYNRNPACHAATYAFGRFEGTKRLFGLGLSGEAIDWPAVVDWANDCDTNGWTANLILLEGGTGANLSEQRVRNLDDLCAAGGARWFQAGAELSFDWHRPRVSLATLTDDDILEAGGGTDAVQTVRDRMNGVRPQYVSPEHNWQQITAAEIVGTTYRTEDGGKALTQVYPLNGVTNGTQAGQLASYAMADSRELGSMDVAAKAEWRFYRPGDCITIDSTLIAYAGQAVINQRGLDPESLAVSLSLKSETPGKHAFALGRTATPPPTPVLAQKPQERDLLASAAMRPRAVDAAEGSTRNVARGIYAAGTTYTRGDEVIFSGSSYRLIVDSSTGNAPPDAARWVLIAAAGSGPQGVAGLEGITITATNQAHNVPTEADGSGGSYGTAGGTMILRRGATVLSPTFSIAAQSPNTGWATINSSTGVYTITDPGATLGTATLRANVGGVNYDLTYTINKTLRGVAGPNLTLVADGQAFTFTDGAASPGSQTITLTALLTNLAGTATWTATPAVTLGGSGNTRTLAVADFGSNRQVVIEATLAGITDRITLLRQERNIVAANAANGVPFSRMEGDQGYGVLYNPSSLANVVDYGEFQSLRFFRASATATASGQQVSIGNGPNPTPAFKLTPNERVSVQARVECQGAAAVGYTLVLWAFEVDGVTQNQIGSVSGGVTSIGAGVVSFFVDVPSWARQGRLELYGFSSGAGAFQTIISEPMVSGAVAGQTLHPAFTPGPNAKNGADVTGQNTALDTANVNGVAAATLTADAATAKANAATALSQISNITSDAVLDKSEKPEVVRQWEAIAAEQVLINARAAAFGITTENTTYKNAISALASYLSGLTPFWYDSGSDTPIVRSTFIGKFNDVYYARQAVLDAIAAVASQRATWAGVTGTGRPQDYADVTRAVLPSLQRGAWSAASVAYALGDIVTRSGSSYTCIVAHTSTGANGPPGSNWALLANVGAQGVTGVSAPPIASLSTGAAQLAPVRLVNGQTVTVAAELYLNTGGVAGVCSLELQISPAGAGTWTTMTSGTVTASLPTSEAVELVITGATFNNSGASRLFDIRAVSVRQSRAVNVPPSFVRVL